VKIIDITIRQFLGLESLDLHLQAPINVIIGGNEAGKSSVRDAIQWCLTGQARGLKTQQEQAALIRDGGKAAEVSLTFADGRTTTRRKTPKSPSTFSGSEDLGPTIWPGILCDPFTFLDWPEAQRRELLFQVIPGLNPAAAEIAKRLFVLCDEEDSVPFRKLTLDLGEIAATKGFKTAETEAITKRREAKRLRDELQVEEPADRATIGETEYILPDISEAEVQEGLVKLRADRDKLLTKRGKVEGGIEKLPVLESELATMEENLLEPPDPEEIEKLENALKVNRPILEKLIDENQALETGKADQVWPAMCPVFSGAGLECPKAGTIAVPGTPSIDPAKVEKLKTDLKEQQEEVATLETELKAAQDGQVDFDLYQAAHQELSAKVEKLKSQKANSEATAALDNSIASLDTRLARGQDLLYAVSDFWRRKAEAEKAQEKIGQIEAEVTLYDTLAKALAPDGLPSRLVAEALGPVNDLLDVASVHLFPGRSLALTEDLDIELSGCPFATLSKSVKFRVGVAFQYVLAKLAGARLLLIDEADLLDPSNRSALISFLLEIQPDFDTIIIFATSQEAKPSPIPEIQIWWLEAGWIRPVETDDAAHDQAAG